MSKRVLQKIRWCCGAALLVVAAGTGLRDDSAAANDGWRRTAQGWELLREESVLTSGRKSVPILLHPLVLAAMQVSLIAAAYSRFPVKA